MEATAEKMAVAAPRRPGVGRGGNAHPHPDRRRPSPQGRHLAFQTDVGMCGPYDSVIGRAPEAVLRHMRTSVHTPYDMGEGDERLCGTVVEFRAGSGRASRITPCQYA